MRHVALLALLAAALTAAPNPTRDEYRESERSHWSLQPRSDPRLPTFTDAEDQAWIRTPVDAFILQTLRAKGLTPAPEAEPAELIRRLYFDLIGLPAEPAAVEAFVADPSPQAYKQIVEQLLASRQYAERWAQHWLDVVRFAETEGFEYDRHRPGAWRYRDYVIDAFHEDKPYTRFLTEQLAGDEIAPHSEEALVAAGFHRLGAVRRNAGNQEVASSRNEVLTERTDIVGTALMGLTVGCARCHDHMYDPIRQKDYYRLEAYMAATRERNHLLATAEQQAAWKETTDSIQARIKELSAKTKELPVEKREPVRQEIKRLETTLPVPLPTISTVRNDFAERTPIHVLQRGDWQNKGEPVGPRPPGVLLPPATPELPSDSREPRTHLARWLSTPEHPLTARVWANRLWQYHFGTGIVETANDFGVNGARPSHPKLLDYLANQLVLHGWRSKPIHRMIVLSSTYRQSSRPPATEAGLAADPGNRLVWRFTRQRLEAEQIRDAMLHVSGKLNPTAGGPSIMVPVDRELINLLYKPDQWTLSAQQDFYRRSIYLVAKRNLRLPFLEVFDQPVAQTSCARRESSTHAPQALELLNGPFANEMADAFAERLEREAGPDPLAQVERAYLLAAGRAPSDREREAAVRFLEDSPLREFALAVFNLNSFLYVN